MENTNKKNGLNSKECEIIIADTIAYALGGAITLVGAIVLLVKFWPF